MFIISMTSVLASTITRVINSDLMELIGDDILLGNRVNSDGRAILNQCARSTRVELTARDLLAVQTVLGVLGELVRDCDLNRDICALDDYFHTVPEAKEYTMTEGVNKSFTALLNAGEINALYMDANTKPSTVRGIDLLMLAQMQALEVTPTNYEDMMEALNAMFNVTIGKRDLFHHVSIIYADLEDRQMQGHFAYLAEQYAYDAAWASTEPEEDLF